MGHCAGFTAARKRALREELAPYETGGRGSGDPSRWDADRDLEWVELRPELVAEVSYDHASGGRIRHGARLAALPRRPRPGELHLRSARRLTGDQRDQGEQRDQRGGGERQGEGVVDERRADQRSEQHGHHRGDAAQRPHGGRSSRR